MEEYIERSAAVCVANYAIDEHPYDKDPARPETFSDYNRGWNDACDYIEEKLESLECPLCYIEQRTLCFVNHNGDFFCAKGKREVDEEDG